MGLGCLPERPALARPTAYRPAYHRPGPLGTLIVPRLSVDSPLNVDVVSAAPEATATVGPESCHPL